MAAYPDERKRILEDPVADKPSKRLQLDVGATETDGMRGTMNGGETEEGEDEGGYLYGKTLEPFRKEAIYRQMLEYKRELARAHEQVTLLERSRTDMEARTGALNAFWDQLAQDVRTMGSDEAMFAENQEMFVQSFSFTPTSPALQAFEQALQERLRASQELLARIITADPALRGRPDLRQLQSRCHAVVKEASLLKEQLRVADQQLRDAETTIADLQERLRRAEKKADRLRSRTVQAMELPSMKEEVKQEQDGEKDAMQEVKEEKSASPPVKQTPTPNGAMTPLNVATELEHLRSESEGRLNDCQSLRQENEQLRLEVDHLKMKLATLPDDLIAESPMFKELHSQLAGLKADAEQAKAQVSSLTQEADDLRERRREFQDVVTAEANDRCEELRTQLQAREADVTRLRQQRDDLQGDNNEKLAREQLKQRQVQEIRTLANSRKDRIDALVSEVRRLKAKIAADAGDAQAVDFHLVNEELSFVKHLETKLKESEESVRNLQNELEAYAMASDDVTALAASEASLKSQVAELHDRVDRYAKLLGSQAGPDVRQLATRLEEKTALIEQLELKRKEAEAANEALFLEVEKLSEAWQTSEEQCKSKVFNLAALEDKKAKADNKYFGAMRNKEAVEAERKAAQRNIEKQVKVIEKLTEAEKSLSSQLTTQEKEISGYKRSLQTYRDKIASLEHDVQDVRNRLQFSEKGVAEMTALHRKRVAEAETEASARKRAEEKASKLERELQNLAVASSTTTGSGVSKEERALQKDNTLLRNMLLCSTCKIRFRSHTISKCFHTFCKDCIDARIATRQRKCPACQVSFAKEDVEQIYFQ